MYIQQHGTVYDIIFSGVDIAERSATPTVNYMVVKCREMKKKTEDQRPATEQKKVYILHIITERPPVVLAAPKKCI